MKNYEEKFFLYLNGKMSSQERMMFENELKKSETLNDAFEEYKNLVHLVNETKNIKVNDNYTESIVPAFRSRLERMDKKKSYSNFKYVFASILIIAVGYLVVSQYSGEKKQELNQVLTDLSNDEIDLIAYDFYVSEDFTKSLDDVSSQKIYSIYAENLKTGLGESTDDFSSDVLISRYNITDIDQYLSDTDIDLIYSQLIEKKIL
ncbi:MAG: hypothetical protein Q8M94_14345 [Ignavibacteria bacterium]|nr:hypothetical protein [Ignavibacteria bacterium]